MRRKLIQLGTNSLMMSIPAKWLRKNLLRKGDGVEITQASDYLTLTNKKDPKKEEITVELDSKQGLFRRMLAMPYIRGYNKIIVKHNSPEAAQFVEMNVSLLTGFEITKSEPGTIVLGEIAHTDENTFSIIFERLNNLVIFMLAEFQKSFETGDFKELDKAASLEDQVNKLNFYCRRILNIYGYTTKEMEKAVYSIIQNLECTGDILRDAIKELPQKELSKDKETANSICLLINMMKLDQKILAKHDLSLAIEVARKERKFLEQLKKIEKKAIYQYLLALFYAIHHVSEEVLYAKENNGQYQNG